MMKIKWLPSFETGIVDIDNDHRELVEAIQKIESALIANDLKTGTRLFHEFLKRAADHFTKEEILLESISFPSVKPHRATHMRLLEMGNETLQIVEADLDHEGALKCLEEMIYFLLEDVIKADAEFKTYAQEKGLI